MQPKILIVDLGSQYTAVIGRTVRELGYRSAIFSPKKAKDWLVQNTVKCIILSGSDYSVNGDKAPNPPEEIFKSGAPILGICYGMQWIVNYFGGTLFNEIGQKEYGPATIKVEQDPIFRNVAPHQPVWASHGDSVKILPPGFKIIAQSIENNGLAGMANHKDNVWGLLFHPEVKESINGKDILRNFIREICKCEPDWEPADMIEGIREEIKREIGAERAIIGFSGGVDSSTLTAIVNPIMGNNLSAVCIDSGALREKELDEIKTNAKAAGINHLKVIHAAVQFQDVLDRETEGERIRKKFQRQYARILTAWARDFGAKYIIQASLAPDFIESGKRGSSALIKTHHNMVNFPGFKRFDPFREFFKYEIREFAKSLGLPDSITLRQPFPGPGLFVRVLGAPPTRDKLTILNWGDGRVREIVSRHNLEREYSQLVVALCCVKTVGIKGDKRAYENALLYRALISADFMTGVGYEFPVEVRREIKHTVTKHPKIVRAWPDENDKPPATTEFL